MKTKESGQAIIEYVLLLSIILGIASFIYFSVSGSRDKMWKRIICEVSAVCPNCPAPESASKLLPRSGVNCKK